MIAKAPGLAADMVFLDLEDSVAPGEKAQARQRAVAAVNDLDWGERVLGVRINAWDSDHTLRDLTDAIEACGPRLDIVMLPKVQSPGDVHALDLLLAQIERGAARAPGSIGIEIQIETAAGLAAVDSICTASTRIEAVHLGPGDLAASLEMPAISGGVQEPSYPGDHFHYAFMRILVAARAAGIQALDGPYFRVRDLDGLRDYSARPRVLGYDGKWAVHPDQIAVINEIFSPTQDQFDRALELLDAYEHAVASAGRGALRFDGEMIDEASRKMAAKLVQRGARAGLTRSAAPEGR